MKSRGFTLIEVLVAMAVLGMACAALFGLLSSSLFNLRKLEDRHRYQLIGEDVMKRVQALGALPPEGNVKGQVRDVEAEWKVVVKPWFPAALDEKPSEAVMKINVDVVWRGRSGLRTFSLETAKPSSIAYENYDFQDAIEKVFPR